LKLTLAVAIGGAFGSVLRFMMVSAVSRIAPLTFPTGTLLVNVLGSFIVGMLYVWFIERTGVAPELRAFLIVGVLGGFTTFSAFSLDTVNLMMQDQYWKASLYVVSSVLLSLLGTGLGVLLGRQT